MKSIIKQNLAALTAFSLALDSQSRMAGRAAGAGRPEDRQLIETGVSPEAERKAWNAAVDARRAEKKDPGRFKQRRFRSKS